MARRGSDVRDEMTDASSASDADDVAMMVRDASAYIDGEADEAGDGAAADLREDLREVVHSPIGLDRLRAEVTVLARRGTVRAFRQPGGLDNIVRPFDPERLTIPHSTLRPLRAPDDFNDEECRRCGFGCLGCAVEGVTHTCEQYPRIRPSASG